MRPPVNARSPLVALAVLVLISVAVVADTYRYLSHTWDEPSHLANGLLLLDRGVYYFEHQHPPLARLAMAVGPYLAGEHAMDPPTVLPISDFWGRMIQGYDEGRRILYHAGAYDRVLTLARVGILPFLGIALVATYVWTSRLIDPWTGVLAAFFLAATPTFIGNAGIATLDLPLAAMAVAGLVIFCRWLDRPSLGSALALGAFTGGAIMTKFSAIPFLGASFVAIAAWHIWLGARSARSHPPFPAFLKTGVAATAAVFLVFWLCYPGSFVAVADPSSRPYERLDNLLGPDTTANRIVSNVLERKIVPYALWEIKQGTDDLRYHNRIGHLSYLLGERGEFGWWNYYLVGLAVRTPIPLLIAGACGLAMMVRASARRDDWRLAAPALAALTVLIFASVFSRINLGIRHILIVYVMLAMGAAYVAALLIRSRRRLAVVIGALLVAAQLSSVVLAHPDHLPYFNVIAGSTPERFLISADLDWGQDMKRLESELRARGIHEFAISFYGSNDLSKHALPGYTPLEPNMPQSGWIALSVWRLFRNEDYAWLRAYQPVARIGKSVNLYYIDNVPHHGPAGR